MASDIATTPESQSMMSETMSSPSCPSPDVLIEELNTLAQTSGRLAQFGTFSGAIYDSAWVSMVFKKVDGRDECAFPTTFEYIKQTQLEDGTWPIYNSTIDGLLNTLSGLLSLVTHLNKSVIESNERTSLQNRIDRACSGLQSILTSWDVENTDHVAFEIIVPAHLRYLEQFGHKFEFQGRKALMQLHRQKMKKFTPEIVYSTLKTTICHSLEALQGLLDFNRVGHHCSEATGICGSPASTAVYLMNTSVWDNQAESYLAKVIDVYGNTGEVPSAFPTCMFELSWAISTLLSSTARSTNSTSAIDSKIATFFSNSLNTHGGIVGFAPGLVEDADDTARTIISLQRLGYQVDPTAMIRQFQTAKHFRTYVVERNPSFSANCNVVLALIESEHADSYQSQIRGAIDFLLETWNKGVVTDKWNLSPDYSHMLLIEVLVCLLSKYDSGSIQLPQKVALQKVPLAICQLLSRSLRSQQVDGGWSSSIEVTAYNVMLISHCLSLPWAPRIHEHLEQCLRKGQNYITTNYSEPAKDYRIWIEKTSYQPRFLKALYCSVALNISSDQLTWSDKITSRFNLPEQHTQKMSRMFTMLPMFRQSSLQSMDMVLVESAIYCEKLEEIKNIVVPRDQIPMTKDKYLQFLPVIWVACNQIASQALSPNVLWEMITISLLNYQMDEYMESVIAFLDGSSLQHLMSVIENECGNAHSGIVYDKSGLKSEQYDSDINYDWKELLEKTTPIKKFINHVLQNPAVLQSPPLVRKQLAAQLRNFLLAHIEHNHVNTHRNQMKDIHPSLSVLSADPWLDYFTWVKSTASDDTSCPFSFDYFTCLISSSSKDSGSSSTCSSFASAEASYISKSLARHLAAMCRQYNDYGSAQRDRDEGNLNSLDFAEFNTDEQAKQSLMNIAEFERECMDLCLRKLKERKMASATTLAAVETFINVTDVFGQIYVQKDIASRVVPAGQVTAQI